MKLSQRQRITSGTKLHARLQTKQILTRRCLAHRDHIQAQAWPQGGRPTSKYGDIIQGVVDSGCIGGLHPNGDIGDTTSNSHTAGLNGKECQITIPIHCYQL